MSYNKIIYRIHLVLTLLVSGAGLMVMIGRLTQNAPLMQLFTNVTAASFNTALAITLTAVASLLVQQGRARIAAGISIFVFILAFATLLQYFGGHEWGIDSIFCAVNTRMTLSTALCLVALSFVHFFDRQNPVYHVVACVCGSLVFSFALLGFAGHFFNYHTDYGGSTFERMAIHASAGLLLLSLVLLIEIRLSVVGRTLHPRAYLPYLIMNVGIFATVIMWQMMVMRDYERNRHITQIRADALKDNLDNAFRPLARAMEHMALRFSQKVYENPKMWNLDAENILHEFGGLRRISWADQGNVTQWVYPRGPGSEKIMGINIGTEPNVRDTVAQVLVTDRPALSNNFELLSGGAGFILFVPIFRDDVYLGMISAALDTKNFFSRFAQVPGYDLTILENNKEILSVGKPSVTFGKDWTYKTNYRSFNTDWGIVLTPSVQMVRDNSSFLPGIVLVFGGTISVLLGLVLQFYLRSRFSETTARAALQWQTASRDSISLLMISLDRRGLIRDMNRAAEEVLGYSSAELAGSESPLKFFSEVEVEQALRKMEVQLNRSIHLDAEFFDALFECHLESATEWTLISRGHIYRNAILSLSQIRNDFGGVTGYLCIFEDITQRKERERLLRDQEQKILTSSRLASLGEMAAGIAHEINNPLAIVSGYVSVTRKLLSQRGLGDDVEITRRIDSIDTTVQRIAKIIRGLRIFAHESHEGNQELVSVQAMIDDTLSFCQEKFKNEGIDLEVNIQADLQVRCRPYQISQVILNLLNNAFDAVASAGEKNVLIEAFAAGASDVHIRVSDSGPGVSAELREKIMQPFFTTKEVGKGIGLGLSISQGIIQGHKGQFYLDTELSRTCFVISLPV